MSGIMPPSAVNESCMALTAPQEAAVVITANSARSDDAEADLLAFHVAAGKAERVRSSSLPWLRPSSRQMTPAMNSTPITARMAQP